MSFRLVPKSVTLNDLERRNGRYLWSPYGIGQTITFSCYGLLLPAGTALYFCPVVMATL